MFVKMWITCTWTERPYEASLFPGISFRPFLHNLGGRRRRPPSLLGGEGGRGQSHQQFLWGIGLPKGNGGVQRFPRARGRPLSTKAEESLTARPTHQAGTKVKLSDSTVSSGKAIFQQIKVTLGITS
ncbi:hypothetical protein ACFX2H_040148 [Malus domestica]